MICKQCGSRLDNNKCSKCGYDNYYHTEQLPKYLKNLDRFIAEGIYEDDDAELNDEEPVRDSSDHRRMTGTQTVRLDDVPESTVSNVAIAAPNTTVRQQAASQSQTRMNSRTRAQLESQAQAQMDSQAQAQTNPQPQARMNSQVRAHMGSQPQARVNPQAQVQMSSSSQAQAKSGRNVSNRSQAKHRSQGNAQNPYQQPLKRSQAVKSFQGDDDAENDIPPMRSKHSSGKNVFVLLAIAGGVCICIVAVILMLVFGGHHSNDGQQDIQAIVPETQETEPASTEAEQTETEETESETVEYQVPWTNERTEAETDNLEPETGRGYILPDPNQNSASGYGQSSTTNQSNTENGRNTTSSGQNSYGSSSWKTEDPEGQSDVNPDDGTNPDMVPGTNGLPNRY